jgi:hypothetical protein
MIILQENGKKFEYYVRALRGKYGNDLPSLIQESNKEIFLMRKNPNKWFSGCPLNNIKVGKFYLINYNFNGNKLYCPIFAIDYRVTDNNKHVLYAINLDYLPFDYKMIYFNKLSSVYSNIFDKNSDSNGVMEEIPIPINFESIYKTLETNGGYHYSISAFDILKIEECFVVSTNLMYLLIHVHMRTINIALMKQLMDNYQDGSEVKEKLKNLLDNLDESVKTYEDDLQSYYKKLRNIENNYKLFE